MKQWEAMKQKYNWFLLIAVILFYKVIEITELGNIGPLLPGEEDIGLGSYKSLVTTFLSNHQYVPLCYVFFHLRHLFNLYCWAINMELIANSTVTHAWRKLI